MKEVVEEFAKQVLEVFPYTHSDNIHIDTYTHIYIYTYI